MGNFQREYCKLQIGCLLIVFYLTFIYYKERKRFRISDGITLYDILLVEGMFCLLLDGITAYTVNHQELVHPTVNLVLHGLFLTSIDILIFLMLLYMLDATEGLEKDVTSVCTSSDKCSDRGVESSFAGISSGRSGILFDGNFGLYLFCNDRNIYLIEYCSCVPSLGFH